MATGRTLDRFVRMYVDGWDLSGYGRTVGPLDWSFDLVDLTAQMSDSAKGGLPGHTTISPGTFNGVLQATTDSGTEVSGIELPGTTRDIMIPIGIRAAPAEGDPVFCCKSNHSLFNVVENGGAITVQATFGDWDASDTISYSIPWGVLLHPKGAETAVNSADGADHDYGAATTKGGYMAYQVFAGSDVAGTIKVQHADTAEDASYADLCSASITATSDPCGGIVQTAATTTTVNRYLRWQITISQGTTVTFALAFVRNI